MQVIDERVSVSVKNILLATDFSQASERAASYTKALARRFSSSVEIAHVFDPPVLTSCEDVLSGTPSDERQTKNKENLECWRRDFCDSGINAHTASPEGHRPYRY